MIFNNYIQKHLHHLEEQAPALECHTENKLFTAKWGTTNLRDNDFVPSMHSFSTETNNYEEVLDDSQHYSSTVCLV